MTIVALGPYEIVAPIGAGGMGEVWRGRDTRLDRSVAIKILPAALAADAQFKIRFEREARAISQLNHPHICTLYDVGDSYLVMELLEGDSLADRLVKGPMPMEQVLRYGTQIADALDKAHRQGIVHRDLKPGNIMITKSGAKLLDFGLAKAAAAPSGVFDATEHKPLTAEGTVIGTFQYMAPEQLEGLEADARTDIFGLGTILYEMATGRRAFNGKTKTSLIAAIVSGEPAPMSHVQPLTPPAFEHVVAKCSAKDRDDRWQSAHDIAEELRWIAGAGSQAAVPAPLALRRKSRERLGWAAAVILALIAGAFASRRLSHDARPSYRFAIPMIDAAYKNGTQPHISPDGKTLYFRATNNANGKFQIFRRRLDDLKATPIEGTEDSVNFLPSPDGRALFVAFTSAVIKRMSADGGPLETVIEGGPGANTVSPDGTILLGGSDQPVRRLRPNQKIEPVTTLDTSAGETGHNVPWFLPEGKHFVFLAASRDVQRGAIRYVLASSRIGSKEITRIGEISSRVEYALGHLFFVRDGTLVARPFDHVNFKFTGEAIPVAENVAFSSRTAGASFSVAADGTIVYQPFQPPCRMTIVSADGKTLGTISSSMSFVPLALFPDGSRAVAAVLDRRAGTISQWIVGLGRKIYFVDGARPMRADFRPDGSSSEPVTVFELRDEITAFQPMSGDRFLMLLRNEVDAAPPVRVIVGWRPPQ